MAGSETQSRVVQAVDGARVRTANRLDLAGVFALVAPLAVTLGLFRATGTIGRIQRDEPTLLWIAIGLVMVAGTLLTIATYLSGEGESGNAKAWSRRLFFAATVLTAAGFVLALRLVFLNAGQSPRPQINAALNPAQTRLTAHVTASNMSTGKRLAVKIDLATLRPEFTVDAVHPFAKFGSHPLLRAYMGPDSDGNVDQKMIVAIPPGGPYTNLVIKAYLSASNHSCREAGTASDVGTACAIIDVDPQRGRAAPVRRDTIAAFSRSSARP